ncbi:MAG: T9SS type A sorting domain-containing protein [bacterium]|nr:T9SS type A sorting domain-containing protein [bacterium]
MKTILIASFILFCYFNKAQVNLDSNLTACYALNGNCYEPISGFTGTMGAVSGTANRNNILNTALAFNGSTLSIVSLPGDTSLKSKSMSVSLWVKALPGFNYNPYLLFTKNSASALRAAYSLGVVNTSGGMRFRIRKCNGYLMDSLDATYSTYVNTWYHVCFTMDNSSIKLYINGLLNSAKTTTVQFDYAPGKKICLGGTDEPGPNQSFAGVLDNVRFYNRILSAAEVNQLYQIDPSCVSTSMSPVAAFSVPVLGLCAGQKVVMVDQSLNNPEIWMWQSPGAVISNSNDVLPAITFSAAGIYSVSLHVSNSVGTNSVSKLITIGNVSTVSVTTPGTLMCRGTSVYLRANGASTCTWSTGQTGTVILVAPLTTTTYSINGTDTIGCLFQSKLIQKVAIDCWSVHEEEGLGSLIIFPNPFKEKFEIASKNQSELSFQVFDVLGNLLMELDNKEEQKNRSCDLSSFSDGIYFLKVTEGTKTRTFKMVKN